MRVLLLRHGETAYNAQGRYLGRTDLPLSPAGRGALIPADLVPRVVYVSPLRRTAETAEILFPGVRQAVIPDLREMDFGVFEGRSWRDMEDFAPYRQWVDGGCRGPVPAGESMAQFCERTCAAFAALADGASKEGAELLAIVAHGGTQMAVMERYALPRRDYFSWRGPLGGGFLLDAARWTSDRTLLLLGASAYTRSLPSG